MNDIGTVLNVVSLGLSIVALALSSFIAWRQAQLMRHANIFPILIDFFREFRGREFREHQLYVRTHLARELPANGIYGLPEPALGHVVSVLYYFDNLGALVAHGVVEKKLALSILGESVERNWRLLAPFLYKGLFANKRGARPHIFAGSRACMPSSAHASDPPRCGATLSEPRVLS